MNLSPRRVGIIGVGHVGAHCAFSLAAQGIVDELVLVDTNRQKAISECQDLRDSVAYLPHRVRISIGQPEDLTDCDLAVISVGTITQDENRLSELFTSAEIVREVVPRSRPGRFRRNLHQHYQPLRYHRPRGLEAFGLSEKQGARHRNIAGYRPFPGGACPRNRGRS